MLLRRSRLPIGQRLALSAAVLLAMFVWKAFLSPPQEVATDLSPGLTSHRYDVPPQMAETFATTYATNKLGWKAISTADTAPGTVTLDAPGRYGLGEDTVTIQCRPEGDRYVRVSISARGRGSGFQHIRDLQAGMDDKLPSAP